MSQSSLPEVGTAVERLRVDCKTRYELTRESRFEMAKDIAAFANAYGGRLYVGSTERGGILRDHPGLSDEDFRATRTAIQEAVRDLVRPTPIVDFPDPVQLPGGKCVLLVDVRPIPGQAVGVRSGTKDEAPWLFPVRVTTHTIWYSPEQLVLLMDATYRRTVQLLRYAQSSGRITIRSRRPPNDMNEAPPPITADIVQIDEDMNALVVRYAALPDETIPLDALSLVRKTRRGWEANLDGYLLLRPGVALELMLAAEGPNY